MFSYPPLSFLANFEVTQKIFGANTVSQNLQKESATIMEIALFASTFFEEKKN